MLDSGFNINDTGKKRSTDYSLKFDITWMSDEEDTELDFMDPLGECQIDDATTTVLWVLPTLESFVLSRFWLRRGFGAAWVGLPTCD